MKELNASEQAARQQASDDLIDISALKQFVPFNRYWLRRMRATRDSMIQSHIYDDMPADKREALRQRILFCKFLENMPATDASIAETVLRNPRQ